MAMTDTLRCDILFHRGHAHARTGNFQASIEAFDQILAIRPNHCFALLHKAMSLSKQKKYQDAVATACASIEADPSNSVIYQYLGKIHYDNRQYHEALKAFDKSLELAPQNQLTMCFRALTYLAMRERLQECHAILKEHITMASQELKSKLLLLCESYLQECGNDARPLGQCQPKPNVLPPGSLQETLSRLSHQLSLKCCGIRWLGDAKKAAAHVHYLKGRRNRSLGCMDEAISEYKETLNLCPDLEDAKKELFDLYLDVQRPEAAWQYFEQMEDHADYFEPEKLPSLELPIIFNLGRYYYQTETYEKAIERFNFVAAYLQTEYLPHYYLGLAHIANKDEFQAEQSFLRAMQQLNPRVAEIRMDEMMRLMTGKSVG